MLYRLSLSLVQILSLILLAVSAFATFRVNYYADDLEHQIRVAHTGSSMFHLFLAILILVVLTLLLGSFRYKILRSQQILLPVSFLLVAGMGLFLVVFGKTIPAADSQSVYEIAQSFARGDYSAIHPTDSYLSYYPQQIGLVGFYEILLRISHFLSLPLNTLHIIKLVNILFAFAIIFFLYRICLLLFQSRLTGFCCILLLTINLPLVFYTSFLYSELPSFAFLSGGIYFLLSYLQAKPFRGDPAKFLCILFLVLSVLLRKNSLVLLVGIVLVLAIEALYQKKPSYLLFAVVLSILCLLILPMVQRIYEQKAGSTLKSGVPAATYFAMGMQESERGCGWYNGFNFNTYLESGMDTQKAIEVSREAIKQRKQKFQSTPGYVLQFYLNKYLTQWTDGSYFCREATNASYQRSSIVQSLYTGELSDVLMHYCNGYQLLLYLGAFGGILYGMIVNPPLAKKENSLPYYLCMIGVLGGFFFHMLWEANSRYLLLYSFLLIPYCARGIVGLMDLLYSLVFHEKALE